MWRPMPRRILSAVIEDWTRPQIVAIVQWMSSQPQGGLILSRMNRRMSQTESVQVDAVTAVNITQAAPSGR